MSYSKEDIIRMVKEEDVEFIRLQFTDIFGQLKNVAITASQIEKAVNDQVMFDGSSIEGFVRIDESDQYLYPDLDSFAIFPWRPSHGRVARLICDVHDPDGKPFVGEKEAFPIRRMILFSALIAFLIGIYDGFYGPGTGTFLLLLLTGVAHMGLKEANGITKAINLTTNLTALAVYLINGKVILLLGLVAGVFSIAGNYLGTRCFDKGGAKFVKPLMMVVLVIFFVKTLSEILGA